MVANWRISLAKSIAGIKDIGSDLSSPGSSFGFAGGTVPVRGSLQAVEAYRKSPFFRAVVKKIADQVQGAGDEMAQLAKAQELLGNEGLKLLPILQQGASGFAAMEQEAVALGLALSPEQVAESRVAWEESHLSQVRVPMRYFPQSSA